MSIPQVYYFHPRWSFLLSEIKGCFAFFFLSVIFYTLDSIMNSLVDNLFYMEKIRIRLKNETNSKLVSAYLLKFLILLLILFSKLFNTSFIISWYWWKLIITFYMTSIITFENENDNFTYKLILKYIKKKNYFISKVHFW